MIKFLGRRGAAFLLAGALCLGGVTGCAPASQAGGFGFRPGDRSGGSGGGSASADASSPMPDTSEGSENDFLEAPPESDYDFSQPAPESEAVENDYFADAAFVGDSRTDGFLIYSGIGCGKNLTSNGLSIFKLDEKKVLTIEGEEYTLLEALELEEYGKVYLSLGINELGTYNDKGFYESYREAIEAIRAAQPDAVIYIQGLIPLNEGKIAETGGRTYLTNEHLRVYNDLMRQAAQEEQVVFLDLYSEFVDENEELPAEASRDGVHLYSDWCKQWLSYLKTHTVTYEELYPGGAPLIWASVGSGPETSQAEETAPEETEPTEGEIAP